MQKILITGSNGQIGSELIEELAKKYGAKNVVGLDIVEPKESKYEFVKLDATDFEGLKKVVEKYDIGQIYHLVSLLSATGEKNPDLAWHVNMSSLKHVLDLAKEKQLMVFWPSSIAAFGPTTPRENTPQRTILEPNTMYGVTKVSGELLCNYYFIKYGVDVRSVRFPGLISWKTPPGGGTTDYAVAIFYEAIEKGYYKCFVREDTVLPMMYMPDAIRAIVELMQAKKEKIKIRTSYNLAAISFKAKDLELELKKYIDFKVDYEPDYRQKIADSWPKTIDDSAARKDWGWAHKYDLAAMTKDMYQNLVKKLKK
ncbi:MAG: NAD-dependent epimerase/dehydratase family protein [Candidatus Micrarchaeota archaeon]|nr:NAD-dependent epimerase/dehydratase family protein [Candidatus Micrarchaeota archaeon]